MTERDPDIEYQRLLRAFVLRELDTLSPKTREWFRDGCGTTGHAEVDAEMHHYLDHSIGKCDECGRRAPLHQTHHAGKVCAWGCERGEEACETIPTEA